MERTEKTGRRVKAFRREFALKEVSVKSLEDILERQGFTIVEFNPMLSDPDVETLLTSLKLGDAVKRTNGFLYADRNFRLVFLNEKLSERERLIVLAHEEGHYYCGHMNRPEVVGRSVQEEFEANEFAHYLLAESTGARCTAFIGKYRKRIAACVLLVLLAAGGCAAVEEYRGSRLLSGDYYVTEHGTKYHLKDCMTIEGHETRRLTKEDVKSGKYEPCGVCMPEN